MRTFILAAVAAATLVVTVSAPAYAGCKWIYVNGKSQFVCGPNL